ncbi:MAG: GMC family oxidoreductase [Gammaproteobacteria bacterium]
MLDEYDYIIIGAGSAGCVLANRLSKDPDNKVLLLEAGGRDRNYLFRLPMLMGKLMHSGIYNWKYYTEPEKELNERQIYWPRGKVLGGSSTINGMIYIRGHADDYDGWSNMGLSGWSYNEVLPYFKRSEGHVDRNDDYHGTQGPLTIRRSNGTNELFNVFIEAGEQAGYPFTDDFNGARQEGFGKYDFTIRNGKRCSAASAFISPVEQRKNLDVQTSVLVQKILLKGNQATGVTFIRNGREHSVMAAKEVILSAGTVNSPQILMLSGIGDPVELEKHAIPVMHDLPGVGKNLHDHVDCCLIYSIGKPVSLHRDLRIDRVARGVVQGALFGTGMITTFPYEGGAFIKSDPSLAKPDIQAHFMPATEAAANLNWPNPFKRVPVEQNHGITIRLGPVNPASRGRITLHSNDIACAPMITANYMADEKDAEVMIRAVEQMRAVIAGKAFAPYQVKEIEPGAGISTKQDYVDWLRETAATTLHPVGSCKMGNDKEAVVDNMLRVHGIERLRIVDASIMPTISSGNTNAPTIMIAEKASDMILEDN